jgi:hypothetical protein
MTMMMATMMMMLNERIDPSTLESEATNTGKKETRGSSRNNEGEGRANRQQDRQGPRPPVLSDFGQTPKARVVGVVEREGGRSWVVEEAEEEEKEKRRAGVWGIKVGE